jgi:hypothetical protein
MERNEIEKQARIERRAWKRLERLAPKVAEAAAPVWQQGDGFGGLVQSRLDKAFVAAGLEIPKPRRRILDALAS